MSEKQEITAEEIVEKLTQEAPQGGEFSLNDAIIKGKLDLRHRIIPVAVTLTNCIFTDEVDLRYCEFKQRVDFSGSRFKKDFNSGDETHDLTIYRKNLICNDAVFEDRASFNGAQCEGSGYFHRAQFENPDKKINFGHARFGVTLECQEAIFKGGANFNSLQCEGFGVFHNVRFENPEEISFAYARFGGNLECQGTTFAGAVSFQDVQISGRAVFWETKFQNSVNFNCATIHNLSLTDGTDYGSKSFPFDEKKGVDLRRCKFEVFEGTEKQQKHVVDAQSPKKFSIAPYLQFERYYRGIGDEAYAKDVYYKGRHALRKNALNGKNPEIRWSLWKVISDWVLCWTVGYGVRMWLALLWISFFLCVGTAVFWSDSALVPKDAEGIGAIKSVVEQIVKVDKAGQTGTKDNFFTHLGHRLWYSIDLFIPVVNLRIVDGYKRFHDWRAVYGVFHIVMGWILVPLLIASLSGIIKK